MNDRAVTGSGRKTIAVLGGGNGAFAAAADMTEAGHEVRWWRRRADSFAAVRAEGGLTVTDHAGTRRVPMAITDSLAVALAGADLVLIPMPAYAQAELAAAIAPHLHDGQVVFLPPGTFGSYLMARIVRENGGAGEVAFAETGTLPWLARKKGAAGVRITTRASRLPTGVFPARLGKHALPVVASAFPDAIEPVEDALSAALMNAGPIIHPPLMLMSAAPIEHFERWDIHKEGTQPAVRRVHDALDRERIGIREALGYAPPHFPLADHYQTSDWMYGNLAHDKLVDSGDWHEALDLRAHRYVSEDVALGLSFLASVGDYTGVACPVAKGILAVFSAITGRDLVNGERAFARLGLAGMPRDALATLLREGCPGA